MAIFHHTKNIITSWWLNQPIWQILLYTVVKVGIFPKFRGENKEYLEPPPKKTALQNPAPHRSSHIPPGSSLLRWQIVKVDRSGHPEFKGWNLREFSSIQTAIWMDIDMAYVGKSAFGPKAHKFTVSTLRNCGKCRVFVPIFMEIQLDSPRWMGWENQTRKHLEEHYCRFCLNCKKPLKHHQSVCVCVH